jgi:hypothetical protein
MTWREATLDAPEGWSHHNVALLDDGTIVGFHPSERALVLFDGALTVLRTIPCEAMEAHDIVADGDTLWLADCGHKLVLDEHGEPFVDPPVVDAVGAVLQVDLDGRTRRRIEGWHGGAFLPTGLALDERGIWIADGYGSNRIDLVAPDGSVLVTIEGFDCCHGVRVRDGLLYVAERGKGRLAVHDLDGAFVRHLGEGNLLAPCSLAFAGDRICVADLSGRVTVLDADGLVTHLGADAAVQRRKGWPNAIDGGRIVPPPFADGSFNSPHGIATIDGDVVVTEWVLGGRWVRTTLP